MISTIRKNINLILAFVAVVITFLVLSPSLFYETQFMDDHEYFYMNHLIQNPGVKSAITIITEVLQPSTVSGYYQPVTMLSLMCDYIMGARPHSVWIIHMHNIILHIVNMLLVMYLLQLLFNRTKSAIAAGFLFGIWPTAVEAVSWISERKTLLSTFFALICLILYFKYKEKDKNKWLYLSELAYCLAFLSKPVVATLPFALIVFDIFIFKNHTLKIIKEKWRYCVLFFVLTSVTVYSQSYSGRTHESRNMFKFISFLLFKVKYYVLKYFIPVDIPTIYGTQSDLKLGFLDFLVPIIICCIIVVCFLHCKKILVGILFYFIAMMSVLSSLDVTGAIINYRYQYFPSIGLIIAMCLLGIIIIDKIKTVRLNMRKAMTASFALIVTTYVLFIISCTQSYLSTWKSNNSLAKNLYRLNSEDDRKKFWYAKALFEDGNLDLCTKYCTQLINSPKTSVIIKKDVYRLLMRNALKNKDFEEVNKYFQLAGESLSVYEMGAVNLLQNKISSAELLFKNGYRMNKENLDCLLGLAKIYLIQGNNDEYNKLIKKGTAYAPKNENVLLARAYGDFFNKDYALALKMLDNCIRENAYNVEVYYLKAKIYRINEDVVNEQMNLAIARSLDKLGVEINMPDLFFE